MSNARSAIPISGSIWMRAYGQLSREKSAYGLGGGNSGLIGRARPATSIKAIWGLASLMRPFQDLWKMHKKSGFSSENFVTFYYWQIRASTTVRRPPFYHIWFPLSIGNLHKKNAAISAFCTKKRHLGRIFIQFSQFLGHFCPIFGYFALFLCLLNTKL